MDRPPPDGWKYHGIERERRTVLLRPATISTLIDRIIDYAGVESFEHRERCTEADDQHISAHRTTFLLQSKHEYDEASDQLLNGAYGIRAHYAVSPVAGDAATRSICQAIARAFPDRLQWTGDDSLLQRSLRLRSAKVWYPGLVDRASAQPKAGTVTCTVWQHARANRADVVNAISKGKFVADDNFIVDPMNKGECVPIANAIAVIGAFVRDDNARAYVPQSKRTRAMQIHLMGWT